MVKKSATPIVKPTKAKKPAKAKPAKIAKKTKPVAALEQKAHKRAVMYQQRGPFHRYIKAWVKDEYSGKRIHADAMSIFENNIAHLLQRVTNEAKTTLSQTTKHKTLSRKDARYALVNVMSRHRELRQRAIAGEERAVHAYHESRDAL